MELQKFIPSDFGWVSNNTPPTNHNNVVVLVWDNDNLVYLEVIGFYENKEWVLSSLEVGDFEILAWFPFPFTPDNN